MGMYNLLRGYLRDSPFANRLISAEKILSALRVKPKVKSTGLKAPSKPHSIFISVRLILPWSVKQNEKLGN